MNKPAWSGGSGEIHTRILQEMRRILLADEGYSFIKARARQRLDLARAAAQRTGLAQSSILPLADKRFLLFPLVWHPPIPYARPLA